MAAKVASPLLVIPAKAGIQPIGHPMDLRLRGGNEVQDSALPQSNQPDLLIVGGGLAGALVALAFAKHRPEVRVELVDGSESFGGNHIWSFFASDLDTAGHDLVAPLVAHRWDAYDIAFPLRSRTLNTAYASITSEKLDEELRRVLGERARTDVRVAALSPTAATLTNGDSLSAGAVLDARGPGVESAAYDCGWQKFVGQELVLAAPHASTRPPAIRCRSPSPRRSIWCETGRSTISPPPPAPRPKHPGRVAASIACSTPCCFAARCPTSAIACSNIFTACRARWSSASMQENHHGRTACGSCRGVRLCP